MSDKFSQQYCELSRDQYNYNNYSFLLNPSNHYSNSTLVSTNRPIGTHPVNVIVTSTVSSTVSSEVIVIYSPVSRTMNNTCSSNGHIGDKLSNMYS